MPLMSPRAGNTKDDQSYIDCVKEIWHKKGAPQLLCMAGCISFGIGSYGIVPAITSDSYARLYHGYDGPECSQIESSDLPIECSLGSADAQRAASYASLTQFFVSFIMSPLLGSLSDRYGRKFFMTLAVFLINLSPIVLVLIQIFPTLDPTWVFVATACSGICGWLGPSFTIISDLVPPRLRPVGFSLIFILVSIAIPLLPEVSAIYGHFVASTLAVTFNILGLVISAFILPETLSQENKEKAIQARREEVDSGMTFFSLLLQPAKELAVVNKDAFFRLISTVIILVGIVKAGERIDLLYYLQGQLKFDDQDTATYILSHSIAGAFAQTYLLKISVQKIGERYTVMVSMVLGIMFNILYGVAKGPIVVNIGSVVSSFAGIAYVTSASILSFNMEKYQQGKSQGIFVSLNALASAVGPIILNYVFDKTVDGAFLGSGTMFYLCALLYFIAAILSYALDPKRTNSKQYETEESMGLLSSETDQNVL